MTAVANGPTIKVDSDYDGYFEGLVRKWVSKAVGCPFETVRVSAGPYRASAVSFEISEDRKTILFDFYSALRMGFGMLSQKDEDDIVAILTNGCKVHQG